MAVADSEEQNLADYLLVESRELPQVFPMTQRLWLIGFAFLSAHSGFAAEETPAPEKPTSFEVRKLSVTTLETHIAQREQRLAELGRDIVTLDTRIEKRIDELVKMIAELPESQEGNAATSQIRKDAVAALKRGIAAYSAKRKEVADNIRSGDATAGDDLGKFDDRINKRVDQIAELTQSIPTGLDSDAPDHEGASYWNGFFFETKRLLDEGRKKGDPAASREQSIKTTQSGLASIDKRRASLHALLAKRKVTESAKQLYTRELGKLDANENHLRESLRDLTMAATKDGQPVSLDPVHDLGQILSDARGDLREDTSHLFRTYDQFAKGRTYVEQLKAELAARKKWVETNKP
jgi:uncharacterized coiled-coil protein SlyX